MLAALALWIMASTLVLLPLLPALMEWHMQGDVGALPVPHEDDSQIGHAAASFRRALEAALARVFAPSLDGSTALPALPVRTARLPLSASLGAIAKPCDFRHAEGFLIVGVAGCPEFSRHEWRAQRCEQTMLAAAPLALPASFTFPTDIYAREGMMSGTDCTFQGVLADDSLHFGANTTLLGWAHAPRVRIEPGAALWGCVSADIALIVEAPCRFTRLGAPRIEFGNAMLADTLLTTTPDAAGTQNVVRHLPHQLKREPQSDRTLIDGDAVLPDNSLFKGHLIVYRTLRIGTGSRVTGSVKSRGALLVGEGATIDGAAISSGDLHLAFAARVRGPLIADREIRLRNGCVVGTKEQPTSITALHIVIEQGALVYGTVSAREHGELIT